jgi:hypothetical protein
MSAPAAPDSTIGARSANDGIGIVNVYTHLGVALPDCKLEGKAKRNSCGNSTVGCRCGRYSAKFGDVDMCSSDSGVQDGVDIDHDACFLERVQQEERQ